MRTIGELSENAGEFAVEWRINNFFSLPAEVGNRYEGPLFSFAGASWNLRIYPNGVKTCSENHGKTRNTEGLGLFLHRATSGPPIHLEFSLGFKTLDGKVNTEWHDAYDFQKIGGYGFYRSIKTSALPEKKFELVPSGVLTVVCKIKYPKTADISRNTATEKCPYCKSLMVDDEDLSSHQQKCMDKPIKCPECSDVVALKDWHGHKCQKTGAKGRSQVMTSLNSEVFKPEKKEGIVKN